MTRFVARPLCMRATEAASIEDFVEIWYSAATREQLRRIQIRR